MAILRPVADTIILEAATDLPEGVITEGVIPEGILIIEEGMATIGEATPTIEAEGLPFTEVGHITEGGIPITGLGIRTMVAGHTTGGLVPGMGHGIFRPDMFLLHRLSMLHRPLALFLIPRSNNHTLILTPHS